MSDPIREDTQYVLACLGADGAAAFDRILTALERRAELLQEQLDDAKRGWSENADARSVLFAEKEAAERRAEQADKGMLLAADTIRFLTARAEQAEAEAEEWEADYNREAETHLRCHTDKEALRARAEQAEAERDELREALVVAEATVADVMHAQLLSGPGEAIIGSLGVALQRVARGIPAGVLPGDDSVGTDIADAQEPLAATPGEPHA